MFWRSAAALLLAFAAFDEVAAKLITITEHISGSACSAVYTSSSRSVTVVRSTVTVQPVPWTDEDVNSGTAFVLEIDDYSSSPKKKRQSVMRMFVAPNGDITEDGSKAAHYQIQDERLTTTEGGWMSTRDGVPTQAFAISDDPMPIQRRFFSQDGRLHWNNTKFFEGAARLYRMDMSIVVVFADVTSPKWTPIQLSARPVSYATGGGSGGDTSSISISTAISMGSMTPSPSETRGPGGQSSGGGTQASSPAPSSESTSPNGICGPETGYSCAGNMCCSSFGYCGMGADYCGVGCQPEFGRCSSQNTPSQSGGQVSMSSMSNGGSSGAVSSPTASSSSSRSVMPTSTYTATGTPIGGGNPGGLGSSSSRMPQSSSQGQMTSMNSMSSSMGAVSSTGQSQMTSSSSNMPPMSMSSTASSMMPSSTLPVSPNGHCGTRGNGGTPEGYTCTGSVFGMCCSNSGFCGNSTEYCLAGCQTAYGSCTPQIGNPITANGHCGPTSGNETCTGGIFGPCCSTSGYCGSTGEYCAAGNCDPMFGTCERVSSSSMQMSSSSMSMPMSSSSRSSSQMMSPSSSAMASSSQMMSSSQGMSSSPSTVMSSSQQMSSSSSSMMSSPPMVSSSSSRTATSSQASSSPSSSISSSMVMSSSSSSPMMSSTSSAQSSSSSGQSFSSSAASSISSMRSSSASSSSASSSSSSAVVSSSSSSSSSRLSSSSSITSSQSSSSSSRLSSSSSSSSSAMSSSMSSSSSSLISSSSAVASTTSSSSSRSSSSTRTSSTSPRTSSTDPPTTYEPTCPGYNGTGFVDTAGNTYVVLCDKNTAPGAFRSEAQPDFKTCINACYQQTSRVCVAVVYVLGTCYYKSDYTGTTSSPNVYAAVLQQVLGQSPTPYNSNQPTSTTSSQVSSATGSASITSVPTSTSSTSSRVSSTSTSTGPYLILTSPTPCNFGDPPNYDEDDSYCEIDLPFAMQVYSQNSQRTYASTNGYLSILEGSSQYEAAQLPYDGVPPNTVAPFFDDLYLYGTSSPMQGIFYQFNAAQTSVQYEYYLQRMNNTGTPPYHFIVSYDSARPGVFRYTYYSIGPANDQGIYASVGMQGINGAGTEQGFSYSWQAGGITPGLVVECNSQANTCTTIQAGGLPGSGG